MKIRITGGGIHGADGEIPIGTELTLKEEPTAWAGRYEIIGKDAPKDAAPVTNPAQDDDKPARRTRAAKDA